MRARKRFGRTMLRAGGNSQSIAVGKLRSGHGSEKLDNMVERG